MPKITPPNRQLYLSAPGAPPPHSNHLEKCGLSICLSSVHCNPSFPLSCCSAFWCKTGSFSKQKVSVDGTHHSDLYQNRFCDLETKKSQNNSTTRTKNIQQTTRSEVSEGSHVSSHRIVPHGFWAPVDRPSSPSLPSLVFRSDIPMCFWWFWIFVHVDCIVLDKIFNHQKDNIYNCSLTLSLTDLCCKCVYCMHIKDASVSSSC